MLKIHCEHMGQNRGATQFKDKEVVMSASSSCVIQADLTPDLAQSLLLLFHLVSNCKQFETIILSQAIQRALLKCRPSCIFNTWQITRP